MQKMYFLIFLYRQRTTLTLHRILQVLHHKFSFQSPFLYSKISPGWQSRTSHIASKVENRIALIFPVFILDRLTLATPTFSDNYFKDIFLSAITLSNLIIIGKLSPHNVSSDSFCKSQP